MPTLLQHFIFQTRLQMSEPHVKRYIDGSITASTLVSRASEANARQGGWLSGRDVESDFADDSVATVGLEFVVDLPRQISTGVFATRRVSCTAFVGDIYKAVTYANLSIVDGRSAKAIATVRTPSHLLHSSSKNTLSSRYFLSCF